MRKPRSSKPKAKARAWKESKLGEAKRLKELERKEAKAEGKKL